VGDFITGGGYVIPTQSSGLYASDAGRKTNFGFNVKYNKSGTNLQGNMNFIFRRTVGGLEKIYQIKANSMTSLGVNIANPNAQTAVFVSKCNLTDITNPSSPVSVAGNLSLQVNMTDRGEPGSNDDIAISLYSGSTLWYSSNWTGNSTALMLLAGGNLVVHSGFSLGGTITQTRTVETQAELVPFTVKAYPNPTDDYFMLSVRSDNNEPVDIKVFGINGKLVYATKGAANQMYRFGETFINGAYIVEVRQGDKRSTIKLLKH
jgi:hypothetical protein